MVGSRGRGKKRKLSNSPSLLFGLFITVAAAGVRTRRLWGRGVCVCVCVLGGGTENGSCAGVVSYALRACAYIYARVQYHGAACAAVTMDTLGTRARKSSPYRVLGASVTFAYSNRRRRRSRALVPARRRSGGGGGACFSLPFHSPAHARRPQAPRVGPVPSRPVPKTRRRSARPDRRPARWHPIRARFKAQDGTATLAVPSSTVPASLSSSPPPPPQ